MLLFVVFPFMHYHIIFVLSLNFFYCFNEYLICLIICWTNYRKKVSAGLIALNNLYSVIDKPCKQSSKFARTVLFYFNDIGCFLLSKCKYFIYFRISTIFITSAERDFVINSRATALCVLRNEHLPVNLSGTRQHLPAIIP